MGVHAYYKTIKCQKKLPREFFHVGQFAQIGHFLFKTPLLSTWRENKIKNYVVKNQLPINKFRENFDYRFHT